MTINPDRVLRDLDELAQLTGNAGGAQRLCWTPTWEKARIWLRDKAAEIGMQSENDEAGNQWLTLPGESDETIIVGSHLDSVRDGGKYDGALGVLAGLEIGRTLAETGKRPSKTFRVASFADEEGVQFGRSLIGSGAVAKTLRLEDIRKLRSLKGESVEELINAYGASIEKFERTGRWLKNARAYVELHIEQGPVLERLGKPLAAVSGTYGADRYQATFSGRLDHIAASPMIGRKDALVTAARVITLVRDTALRLGGVGSVGRCEVAPNFTTTVAEGSSIIIEHGHDDLEVLQRTGRTVRNAIRQIAAEEGVEVRLDDLWSTPPVRFDPALVSIFEEVVGNQQGKSVTIPSGPLHDAAEVAAAGIPTAMLFVRSRDGISHSPAEFTDNDDIRQAVIALNSVVERLI